MNGREKIDREIDVCQNGNVTTMRFVSSYIYIYIYIPSRIFVNFVNRCTRNYLKYLKENQDIWSCENKHKRDIS
jgi:hypothetical protein